MSGARRGMRRLFRLESTQRDVEDELTFHFENVVEELMSQGHSRDEAERAARRRFGDERRYRDELTRIDRGTRARRQWGGRADALRLTVAHAWRGIRRTPGLAAGIVLAFALGIGANATVFGIVDRLLLSPPPHIVSPASVKKLVVERYLSFMNGHIATSSITWNDYQDLTELSSFAAVGAYTSRRDLTIGRGETAEQATGVLVTASFWEVTGVRPVLGRFFGPDEDRIGAAGTVVLSHGYWQRKYGEDRSVLGRTIDFGHGPYTVVGVTPAGFTGVSLQPVDLWLPLVPAGVALQGETWLQGRGYYWMNALARMAPEVTAERAVAEASAAHRMGRGSDIERGSYDAEARVLPMSLVPGEGIDKAVRRDDYVRETRSWGLESDVALWLAGVSAIVLLIACVNVANLMLARALRQRREVGIRLALGVSQRRLVVQTVAEALLLALMGAAGALVAARWGGDLLRTTLLPDIAWDATWAWGRMALVVTGLAVVAGVIAAIAPAREAMRGDVGDTLRASAAGITRTAGRTRATLAVAQAALSVLLLVGAGLFVRSLHRITTLDLGFDAQHLTLLRMIGDDEPEGAEAAAFFDDAAARLRGLPGIESVTHTQGLPMYTSYAVELEAEGLDSIPSHVHGGPYIHVVGPDFLRTFGIRVARGRAFQAEDRRGSTQVALINDAMARHLWPGQEALGRCLRIDGSDEAPATCTTVVGIVRDTRRGGLREETTPQYYVLAEQGIVRRGDPDVLVVRTRPGAQLPIVPIRAAIFGLDPRLRWVDATPYQELIDPQIRSWKLGATMFTVFGALALLVAAIGLYSVLGFDVAQRTREIGLRAVLGADRGRILGMIVGRGIGLAAIGVALGLVVAIALAPRLGELLYETSPRDPLVLAVTAAVLLGVASLASAIPAWRAARVDPNVALRAE